MYILNSTCYYLKVGGVQLFCTYMWVIIYVSSYLPLSLQIVQYVRVQWNYYVTKSKDRERPENGFLVGGTSNTGFSFSLTYRPFRGFSIRRVCRIFRFCAFTSAILYSWVRRLRLKIKYVSYITTLFHSFYLSATYKFWSLLTVSVRLVANFT